MRLSDLGNAIGDRLDRHSRAVRLLQPAYGWMLQTAYGRRGLPWHVNGEPLRIDPRVRHFIPHVNEPALFQYLRAHIHPVSVVVDIGAFVGTYAIMEARWTGPAGRVLAFEPSPSTFTILERHLRMNGLRPPHVEARCAALGARAERRDLVVFDEEPYRNMIAPGEEARRRVAVDVTTLDTVCASWSRPPDVIRMDVQGLEFDVLEGARDVIRAGRNRLMIVAEMHPQLWPEYGIDARHVVERLTALGLEARSLPGMNDLFEPDAHAILEPINRD